MKTLLFIFLSLEMHIGSLNSAQVQNDDKQIIIMLKEFYSDYNAIWANGNDPKILIKKIDLIEQKYCSKKLYDDLKKLSEKQGLDHDIFTNDFGTDDESLKTMSIIKDPQKTNEFIVSYIVSTSDPVGKKIKEKVTIHIVVVKDKESYKIDDVH